ncbi:hypothetical protein OGM63_15920 [Plectonema radiosum NIES-515]|uniref:Uncharacterized protein n=1 Tax=Plectonema radiosum NIES-515 TaxID=2986073 RepID=A0ABT3B0T1_9CYAN|nr:hypothetical protein [Plectonema radiosum]MCV3214983.1 hypothetical protein [Plectonema radiosum NIES-515]
MKLYHKKLVKAIALIGSHQCSIDTVIDCRKSDRAEGDIIPRKLQNR